MHLGPVCSKGSEDCDEGGAEVTVNLEANLYSGNTDGVETI